MPDHDHPYGRCLCLAIRRLSRVVTQAYDGCLAPAQLTVTQFSLLSALAAAGEKGVSLSPLASAMDMDLSTVSRTLRPLAAQGLVVLVAGADKRERKAALTPDGVARWRLALPLWTRAQEKAEAAFGPGAFAELSALLRDARELH